MSAEPIRAENLKATVIQKLLGQEMNTIMLVVLLSAFGYAFWWGITTGVPAHLREIKRYGVETVPEFVLIDAGNVVSRQPYRGRMTVVNMLMGGQSNEPQHSQLGGRPSLSVPVAVQAVPAATQWYSVPMRRRR